MAVRKKKEFITSEEVDLRQMAVQYMYDMANIEWTASQTLNYAGLGAPSLVYEAGKTYLGMVYNNNKTGLENFKSQLDENNVLISSSADWNDSVGNSCSTSIAQAWRQISPSVEFAYSVNMLPYYKDTGVIAVGDVNWEHYNEKNTLLSVVSKNDREVIYEAYALGLPGDALIRYLGTGGHALMITKEPKIVRTAQGYIDPERSYVFLTDQNNRLHTRRKYPSSWMIDNPVKFTAAYKDGYLPVTTRELQEGKAPVPVFEVNEMPKVEILAKGELNGTVQCNYAIHTIRAEITVNGEVVAAAEEHPYTRKYEFQEMGKGLRISELQSGTYQLVIEAKVGLGEKKLVEITFTKEASVN